MSASKNQFAFGHAGSINPRRGKEQTASQRAMIGGKLASLVRGEKKSDSPGKVSEEEAAKLAGTTVAGVKRGKAVERGAVGPIKNAVKQGKLKVTAAVELVKLPKDDQQKIAKKGPAEMRRVATEMRRIAANLKREETLARLNDQLLDRLDQFWAGIQGNLANYTLRSVFDAVREIVATRKAPSIKEQHKKKSSLRVTP